MQANLINKVSFVRLAVVTFIVLIIQLPSAIPIPKDTIYSLAILGIAISLLYRILPKKILELKFFLFLVFIIDSILITSLLYFTGKAESDFYFLYILPLLLLAIYTDGITTFMGTVAVCCLYLLIFFCDFEKIFIKREIDYFVFIRLGFLGFITATVGALARSVFLYQQEASARGKLIRHIKHKHHFQDKFDEFLQELIKKERLKDIFELSCSYIKSLFDAEGGIIFKESEVGFVGEFSKEFGERKLSFLVIPKNSPLYLRLRQNEIAQIPESNFIKEIGVACFLFSPIPLDSKNMFVFSIYNSQPLFLFSVDDEINFLRFCNFISSACHKVLHKESATDFERRYIQLESILQRIYEFLKKEFKSNKELTDEFIKNINELFYVTRCRVMLIDKEKADLYVISAIGIPEVLYKARVRVGDYGVGEVAASGQAKIYADLKEGLKSQDLDTLCILPLKKEGEKEPFGVFDLMDIAPGKVITQQLFYGLEVFVKIFSEKWQE